MSNSQAGLQALFGGAAAAGVLSQDAFAAIDINDIGADIQDALGVSVDDITASEVTLVTLLVDDSSSINHRDRVTNVSNAELVREGHNLVLSSLAGSKQRDSILGMCRLLNRGTFYPYNQIAQAIQMDDKNYRPSGGTPLFDETVTTLATVVAKAQDFADNGIACRTVTLIATDGADSGSRNSSAADVNKIVQDLFRQECHIVAFMGIWDGQNDAAGNPIPGTGTDFRAVAKSMGIPDEWILTPGNTPSEIRAAFAMFSQSAQRASQSAASFSQSAMGGFGTP